MLFYFFVWEGKHQAVEVKQSAAENFMPIFCYSAVSAVGETIRNGHFQ